MSASTVDLGDSVRQAIVICLAADADTWVRILLDSHPGAAVHLLTADAEVAIPAGAASSALAASIHERVDAALCLPRPDLFVESGNHRKGQKRETFKRLFGLLNDGGRYLVDRWDLAVSPEVSDVSGETVAGFIEELLEVDGTSGWHGAVAAFEQEGPQAVVVKRGDHLAVLNDNNEVAVAIAHDLGSVIERRARRSPRGPRDVFDHGPGAVRSWANNSVPETALIRYPRVEVRPTGTVILNGFVLAAGARGSRDHQQVAGAEWIGPHCVELPAVATVPDLEGSYFLIDLTDDPVGLLWRTPARQWAWQTARTHDPDIRPMVCGIEAADQFDDLQKAVLTALDVDPAEVTCVSTPAKARDLYTASSLIGFPRWIDPDITRWWDTVGEALAAPDASSDDRGRIFLHDSSRQECTNLEALQEILVSLNYRPLDVATSKITQVAAALRTATVVAATDGPHVGLLALAGQARMTLVTADPASAALALLVATARSARLHVLWAESTIDGYRVDLSERMSTELRTAFA